jgi:hypothetical protein
VTGRQGRRSKQLLVAIQETGDYWKLEQEALDYTRGELASEEVMDLS